MSARISCGGAYHEIDPALVIEGFGEDFPQEWLDSVTKQPYRRVRVPLLPAAFGEACVFSAPSDRKRRSRSTSTL
jgi:hypothetical protein